MNVSVSPGYLHSAELTSREQNLAIIVVFNELIHCCTCSSRVQ